ncbi:MAG TPA: hypothetical protein VGN68_04290 [Sphingopyxis sp.]|jgi:hypothetical protein|uniref:hypothetical protein n=1 Tax=Sphingopyxis sp. TaxID=1908224 RepID=UPI002E14455A|nr:hypothetical protein [Sphingopyxis sp.]
MTVIPLPIRRRAPSKPDPGDCVLCDGPLVPVPMLGSMGCADCGSTFTLDGLAAQRRRQNAAPPPETKEPT